MACKTKKLKLRKYSKGSTLPKKDTGGLTYMDQSSEIFTPNSNQYNSLGSYNRFCSIDHKVDGDLVTNKCDRHQYSYYISARKFWLQTRT